MIFLVGLDEHFPPKKGDVHKVSAFPDVPMRLLALKKFLETDHRQLRTAMRKPLSDGLAFKNEHLVRRCRRHRSIYELRGGCARLMFFRQGPLLVCTTLYVKESDDSEIQDAAFDQAEALRLEYMKGSG